MTSQCCNGTCDRKEPIRVLRSDLTGRIWALTRYKVLGDGMLEAKIKHDVTVDVTHLLAEAFAAGVVAREFNAGLAVDLVPNPYAPS